MGNGDKLHCQGSCRDVLFKLQNREFSTSFFVLPIQGADVVLGVQWLETLGPVLADFKVPRISFNYFGQIFTLHGEHRITPSTPNQIQRMLQTDSIASLHTLTFIPTQPSLTLPLNSATDQPP